MSDTIGRRIRYWRLRRRGMTQAVLAGLAGVSQPYVSQIESGARTIDSRSTLIAFARALKVTVSDLLGQPGDPTDPIKSEVAGSILDIWAALIEIEEGERRAPTWPKEQVQATLARVDHLRDAAEISRAVLLPQLLIEAAAHGTPWLVQAAYQTAACVRLLGHREMSLQAARIALHGARDMNDPSWIGAAQYSYTRSLPIEHAALTGRATDRAVAELQAEAASEDVRRMLGQVHLVAALAYATDRQRPGDGADDAAAQLAEADREAASLGDPADGAGFAGTGFGPTNARLWRMAIDLEFGEWGRVVEASDQIRPDPLRAKIRHQFYWLARGRALTELRRDGEAMGCFQQAEMVAPTTFALDPIAQSTVQAMVYRARRRAVPAELRILARRLGIEA